MRKETRADRDSPWKETIERFFRQFMALYFPEAHREIDWDQGFQFLDKELQRIRPRSAIGRRTVDKLARVYLKTGGERWILVHVEVQGEPEEGFTVRVYEYHYRIFDRYDRPVATFVVLADSDADWRPQRYYQEVLGCISSLEFPVVKLLDFGERWVELEQSNNPTAVVTMAYLMALQTGADPAKRLSHKLWMVRRLRGIGLSQEEREELFRLIDWFMELPEALQLEFDERVEEEEETMPFVTSIERRAEERGRQEGHQEGWQEGQALLLAHQLERKFGPLPAKHRKRVAAADADTIRAWSERVLTAERLQDVIG